MPDRIELFYWLKKNLFLTHFKIFPIWKESLMGNNSLLTKKILSWLVHYQYNIFEYNEGLCQNIVQSLEHVDL